MLFLEDSYLKEFETKIEKIQENNVILNDTAFYARSGGQPGDTGTFTINNHQINIIEAIYDDKKNIVHVCEKIENLKIGNYIKAKINWKRRYKHMRMHSALHLLCSIIPYDVTGGQITAEKSRLDFNAIEKLDKIEIENKINNLMLNNYKISYLWITNDELEKKPELVRTMSVKPPKTNNKIRLVKIDDVDLQPCGGTHVKNTKEIGKIIIGKIENKGKMNRRVNLILND